MKDGIKAWNSLKNFYYNGYQILQDNVANVEGLFISDSGILFVRDYGNEIVALKNLLSMARDINKSMLQNNIMLTSSVAFGKFKYQNKIEFLGIEKTAIYGEAYKSAFLNNENGKPKIQPGQCRIVKNTISQKIQEILESPNDEDEILRLVKKRNNDNDHFYFYWMVDSPYEIAGFEKRYNDAYNLKYGGMIKALKGN